MKNDKEITSIQNYPMEAILAIDEVLKYGASKGHKSGAWRNETYKHHLTKAHGHIHDLLDQVDRGEDHLLCALTRLAMAVAVRESNNKKENQNGKA